MSSPIPSPDEQAAVVEPHLATPLSRDTNWCLVATGWLDLWKAYCGVHTARSDAVPPPIDNKVLMDGAEVRTGLHEHGDYELVPEAGYDALAEWYGGGPKIVRSVIAVGVAGELVCEVYRLRLRLVTAPLQDPPAAVISLSKLATLSDLTAAVVDALELDVGDGATLHVYNYYGDIATDDLADPELSGLDAGDTLDRACLVPNQKLLVQVARAPGSGGAAGGSDGAVASCSDSDSDASLADGWSHLPGTSTSTAITPWSYAGTRSVVRARPAGVHGVESPHAVAGVCGLTNLGNTCFMNSGLQCISHTPQLVEYMLAAKHESEINRDNPLGMSGEVADAFSQLLGHMWSGKYSSVAPRSFKYTIGQFAPRFVGFGQQDSQELIAFLLDGLHEDLNRILDKPSVPTVEGGARPDAVVAAEAWDGHRLRNNSIVVDLFQGQLKSRVVCPHPGCGRVSITFDPFMYLTVPVPDGGPRELTVRLVRADPSARHALVKFFVDALDTIPAVIAKLAAVAGLDPASLILTEVYEGKLYKWFADAKESVSEILDEDIIVAYEVPPHILALHHADAPSSPPLSSPPAEAPSSTTSGPDDEAPSSVPPPPELDSSDSSSSDDDDDAHSPAAAAMSAVRARADPAAPYFVVPLNHYKLAPRPVSAYWRARGRAQPRTFVRTPFGIPSVVFVPKPATVDDVEAALLAHAARYVTVPTADDLAAAGFHATPEEREAAAQAKAAAKAEARAARVAAAKAKRAEARAAKKAKIAARDARRAARKAAKGPPSPDELDSSASASSASTISALSSSGGSTEVDVSSSSSSDGSLSDSQLGVSADNPTALFQFEVEGRGPALEHVLAGRGGRKTDSFAVVWNTKLVARAYDEAEVKATDVVVEPAADNGDSAPTLDSCLRMFTQEEELGEDDLWYCSDCGDFRQATKKFDVYTLPSILVIHLKRFRQSRFAREKLDALIDFPIEGLDMAPYLPPDAAAAAATDGTIYDLYAVSDHFGGLGGGHYTAHAKNHRDGNWYYFNDSSAGPVPDPTDVVTSAAYLLFYHRRGSPLHVPNAPPLRQAPTTPPPAANADASDPALTPPPGSRSFTASFDEYDDPVPPAFAAFDAGDAFDPDAPDTAFSMV